VHKTRFLQTSEIIWVILVGAGAMCPFGGGCSKASGDNHEEGESQAVPVPVQTVKAAAETLQPVVRVVGRVTLDPACVASVSSPVEDIVQSLCVTEGQDVEKDEKLVVLDPRAAEIEVKRTGAALAKARSVLERLKAGPRAEEIDAARHEVDCRRVELQSAQAKLDAKEKLHQEKMISPIEWDELRRRVEAAQAAMKGAQDKVRLLEKGTRPEEIAEAQAELQAAEAENALAKLRLQWHVIQSPIKGNLVKLHARVGMRLMAGSPVAEIIDLRQVLIEAVVPAPQLAGIRVGAQAEVTAMAFPERTFTGKVVRMSQQGAPDTGNVPIWIGVENSDFLLRRDMAVRVTAKLQPVQAKVVVPESAIADLDGQAIVSVVREGAAHTVPVKIGQRVAGRVEVIEGIKAGEVVITGGGYGLPEKHPVTVQEARSTTRPSP
jgi:multidrug resistance efflux pump